MTAAFRPNLAASLNNQIRLVERLDPNALTVDPLETVLSALSLSTSRAELLARSAEAIATDNTGSASILVERAVAELDLGVGLEPHQLHASTRRATRSATHQIREIEPKILVDLPPWAIDPIDDHHVKLIRDWTTVENWSQDEQFMLTNHEVIATNALAATLSQITALSAPDLGLDRCHKAPALKRARANRDH